ncbi:MAG: PAS domain S-box protein, partial [Pseudomonadota bacterium]
ELEDIRLRLENSERALRESEERFRTVFEQGPLGMSILRPNLERVAINAKLTEMFGYTKEELRDLTFLDLTHPDDLDLTREHLDKLVNKEIPFYEIEKRYIRKDGEIIWVRVTLSSIRDSQGELLYLVSMIEEITDRKRSEEALRAGEERFRFLFENLPIAVWEEDLSAVKTLLVDLREQGVDDIETYLREHPEVVRRSTELVKITNVNQACAAMFEASDKEDLIKGLGPVLAPESYSTFQRELIALWNGETERVTDAIVQTLTGKRRKVIAYGAVCPGYEQTLSKVLVSTIDITEREQAEQERLANLRFFESMDRINRAIQGTNDLERMMSGVLDIVLSIFDCDRACLMYPCDPQASSWTCSMERTKPEYPGTLALGLKIPMDEEVAETLRIMLGSDGPVKFGPGTSFPLPRHASERLGFKSFMSMALHPKVDKPWQFGIHQCSYARIWTHEEERFFQEIGRRVEDALSAMLAHRNLQDNMEKLEEAQRIGHIGYWDRDIAGNRISLADETCRIFGISRQGSAAGLEQWHEHWLTLLHPEDRERVNRAYVEALASGPRYNTAYRIVRPDGEVRHIHSEANVTRDESGRAIRMLGMMQDITGYKRAQEAASRANKDWEQTFNAIPDMVMVLDRRHRILRANKAMAAVLGRPEEELKGRFCFELVHDAKQPPAFCPHSVLLQDGTEHCAEVFEPTLRRSLDVRVSPLSDETGTVIGSVHVIRDVTEQKNLQKQLLQAQKMESVGTLAGGIAHDFNNLLQIILGYSDMLLFKKNPGDPGYDELNSIRLAGKDGAELAKRILAFSRRLDPKTRPVNLNNEIVRVQKMLERTVPKMIRIELLLADNLMTVNADPGQMEQILLNLAVNAQYAMPDGGRLTIETANVTLDADYSRTHLHVEPGRYVLLSVSDSGCGMDKEVLEHIFEPFYTTKGVDEGTGLGLAMVFGIVKSHKGHIICYSEPGEGTTFKIYLPAVFREIERDPAVTRQLPAFGTETILLVDDEKAIRKLGEGMLRMAGYTVLTAADGREALEIYRAAQDRIALVLLDLMMPEMGGKQCLEELFKINERAKVVIASGYSANGPTKDALARAKGFINKPYQVRDLLAVVREALDSR